MNIVDRYRRSHDRTRESIELLCKTMTDKDLEQYILLLDLLAVQYDILYNTIENMGDSRIERSRGLAAMNAASNNIFRMLSMFPTSPVMSRKIKKMDGNGGVDVKEYLDNIMK